MAASSMGSSSTTTETKPCSAMLCPGLAASPAESPESTFEKRRSVASLGQHSSSKSSGNLTTSTRSSGGPRAPTPRESHSHLLQHQQQPLPPPAPSAPPVSAMSPILSFTQQLQQCGRGRGRRHPPPPPQPALTPLDEPASPIYASPPLSPLSDGPGGGRNLHSLAILEDDYTVPLQHPAVRAPRPSAPPVSITAEVSSLVCSSLASEESNMCQAANIIWHCAKIG